MVIFSKKNGGRITDGDIMGITIGFSKVGSHGNQLKSIDISMISHWKSAPVLFIKNRLRITLAGFPTNSSRNSGCSRRRILADRRWGSLRGNASMEVLGALGMLVCPLVNQHKLWKTHHFNR